MKKLFFTAFLMLFSTLNILANTWYCQFMAGEYTSAITADVRVKEGSASITTMGNTLGSCEYNLFDEVMADQVLRYKLDAVAIFYGDEAVNKIRETYKAQLDKATGGTLVACKLDGVSSVGIIANGENSFVVMDGGNAYFDMTEGRCN